jgi:16S rRNA (guanine966-N2)-methyltransferase
MNTKSIENNAKILNTQSNIDACCIDFFSFSAQHSFDIIFLDPPYHQGLLIKAISYLAKRKWIHQDTVIYIEGEQRIASQLPQFLKLLKQKKTKHTFIALGKPTQ